MWWDLIIANAAFNTAKEAKATALSSDEKIDLLIEEVNKLKKEVTALKKRNGQKR